MKLKLTNDQGVAVLDVLEEVGPRGLEILRAGLQKLLETGRNRIIVSFRDARALDLAIMSEIIKFHEMARELDGQVMLVGQGELIRRAAAAARVASLPLPRCYSTKKAALAAMHDLGAPSEAEVDYALGDDPNGLLKKRVAQLAAELETLNTKARELKQAVTLRELRRENGQLERQLKLASEELTRIRAEKRAPFKFEDLDRKVDLLRRSLAWLLGQAGLAPAVERPRELPAESGSSRA